eukprot:m.87728 g.87728  ORF g.87728 m.87728 type:complete len:385 (+) comp14793_c0_seq1:172-1326(+)
MAQRLRLAWSPLFRVPSALHNSSIFSSFACQAIKRDDCLDLEGNKARKLYLLATAQDCQPLLSCTPLETDESDNRPLTSQEQAVAHHLRQLPPQLISWGGNQSNAMMAIAQLCQHRGWDFSYLTPQLHAKASSKSNHEATRCLDTNFIWSSSDEASQTVLASLQPSEHLIVRQGAAGWIAALGFLQLALELSKQLSTTAVKHWYLLVPSGTGTTALWLQAAVNYLRLPATVVTIPAVGSATTLTRLMEAETARLDRQRTPFAEAVKQCAFYSDTSLPDGKQRLLKFTREVDLAAACARLQVVSARSKYSTRFASLHADYLTLWHQHNADYSFPLDLIYAPKAWLSLSHAVQSGIWDVDVSNTGLCVIHTGGTTGNASMLQRYAS